MKLTVCGVFTYIPVYMMLVMLSDIEADSYSS